MLMCKCNCNRDRKKLISLSVKLLLIFYAKDLPQHQVWYLPCYVPFYLSLSQRSSPPNFFLFVLVLDLYLEQGPPGQNLSLGGNFSGTCARFPLRDPSFRPLEQGLDLPPTPHAQCTGTCQSCSRPGNPSRLVMEYQSAWVQTCLQEWDCELVKCQFEDCEMIGVRVNSICRLGRSKIIFYH